MAKMTFTRHFICDVVDKPTNRSDDCRMEVAIFVCPNCDQTHFQLNLLDGNKIIVIGLDEVQAEEIGHALISPPPIKPENCFKADPAEED